jgi:nucleoid DNA-binding protein
LKKAVFIRHVAGASQLSAAQVDRALKAIQDVSAMELKERGSVRVPGLVSIKRMSLGERYHRLPNVKDPFVLPAATLVKARPVAAFARRVKDENPATI